MTIRSVLTVLAVAGFVASCSPDTGEVENTATTTAEKPAASATETAKQPSPKWLMASRGWPDTLRWEFDSLFEYKTEDLLVRIRPEVGLDASGVNFPGQKPLISRTLVTMRPVTDWVQAKGFKLDSLIVHDPKTQKTHPGQPLLSFERGYTENTVRTTFLPNMAIVQEPSLDEGQPINITIYMTWDHRTIIGTFPEIQTRYRRGLTEW